MLPRSGASIFRQRRRAVSGTFLTFGTLRWGGNLIFLRVSSVRLYPLVPAIVGRVGPATGRSFGPRPAWPQTGYGPFPPV
jgi:hypothetical protein